MSARAAALAAPTRCAPCGPPTRTVRHTPVTVPRRKVRFLLIARDPSRRYQARFSMNRQPRPGREHTLAFWSDQGSSGLAGYPQDTSGHLAGLLQPALPGRGLRTKAALGAGAEPVAELRRHVAERAFLAELERGIHRPVRVVEDFAAHGDQVGLLVAQDLLGLVAVDDETDRHGHDVGMGFDILRQRHLIAVLDFLAEDRGHVGDAARGAVDHVNTLGLEDFREPRTLLRTTAGIVLDRQAHEQRLLDMPVRAYGFRHLGAEEDAVSL